MESEIKEENSSKLASSDSFVQLTQHLNSAGRQIKLCFSFLNVRFSVSLISIYRFTEELDYSF